MLRTAKYPIKGTKASRTANGSTMNSDSRAF
jgi:hypothetical protein